MSREAITYTGKNGAAVKTFVNEHGGVDGERETWFMTRSMSAPTGHQAWRYIKGTEEWPEGTRAAVYDPATSEWLPLAVGDIVVRLRTGHAVRKPGSDLYENGHTYVCTEEPYHENSTLLGCAQSLSAARELCGLPDPEDWQEGDPVTIDGGRPEVYDQPGSLPAERRLWYSTQGPDGGDPLVQIVESPVFGPWT